MMGALVYRQESDTPIPSGEVTLRMEFDGRLPHPSHRR